MRSKPLLSAFLALTTGLAITLLSASGANAARPRCLGKRATIVGTARGDVIRGTARSDVIVGLGGNDVITGSRGNDLICGGDGKDEVEGAAGDDILSGDAGNDSLSGGPGTDTADFSSSGKAIDAELDLGKARGDGRDKLSEIENLVGSKKSDFLFGDSGENSLDGGSGDDFIGGADGDDQLEGGGGGFDLADFEGAPGPVTANLATGTATGEGNDTLTGIESLIGSPNDDTLTGDDGSNLFAGLGGNDAIDGGDGISDFADFEIATGPVTASLVTGTATGEGNDTLTGIEGLIGSPNADTLTGDDGSNTILGLAGDDQLDGGPGNDVLDGGDGTDTCLNGETNSNCEP